MKKLIILLGIVQLVSCTSKYEKKGFKSENEYRNHLTDSIKSSIISEIDIEFEEATSNILAKAGEFNLDEIIYGFNGGSFAFYFKKNKLHIVETIYNYDKNSSPLITCEYSLKDGYVKFSNCDKKLKGDYYWGEANVLYSILEAEYKLEMIFDRSLLDKSIEVGFIDLKNYDDNSAFFRTFAYKNSSNQILNDFIDYNKYNNLDKQQYTKKVIDKKKSRIDYLVRKIMKE